MGKRGPKPKGKIKIKWSPNFAYAIGLIVTDGNLSPDGRHLNFTTKDYDLAQTYKICLEIDNKIGLKSRANEKEKKYYAVQFGDVIFYRFLLSIGLIPAKSKTLEEIDIPEKYFFDFLRGVFDGDGYSYSYWDKRWRSSFMFYLGFCSASKIYTLWLRGKIKRHLGISGHITKTNKKICYQLKYSKYDAIKLVKKMYYSKKVTCLVRKRLKIEATLAIVSERASGET
jgi:hypothetical protein